MKKAYLFLLMYCLSIAGYSQTAASYGLTVTTGSFTTISGTGTAIAASGMNSQFGSTTSIPIGFNFTYCGSVYTVGSANANGWFSLANSSLGASPSNINATGSLPSISGGAGLLMPMWAGLYGVGQTAYYQTTGSVGSRIFTMEWKNWGVCCATGLATMNFQVKLYEGTNVVEFWYGTNTGAVPTNGTIGICNGLSDYQTLPAGTSTFSNTSFNTTCSPANNGTLIRWCPAAPAITGGTSAFCPGATTTLSNTMPGGSWSSANPSVATVNPSTGVVTGVSTGTATISYTPACGTAATMVVTISATPTTFTVTGGGGYCAGTAGALVGLDGSTTGVSYQLYNGATTSGAAITGTGAAFNFPAQPASGTYTIVATIPGSCTATMLGSTVVSVNPLPTPFSMTGGGPYCVGGSGSTVGLSSSTIGVNYQLYMGGTTPVGTPVVGTGGAISFGSQVTASVYTATGINGTTGCQAAMTGSATVSTSALPTSYAVTGGGGYCLGGTGELVGLSNSTTGITYTLLLGVSPVATLSGTTGSALNFGSQTLAGTYTIQATNPATTCTTLMSGNAIVTINALPVAYTVGGGGAYCSGGVGMPVTLSSSQVGVNYQLYQGLTPVGSPIAGTSVSLNFGNQTNVGSYTVVATNATTSCVNNMFASAAVTVNPLPVAFTVTGGGGYCAGGTGAPLGLAGSTSGVNYVLYNGTTVVSAAAGTGSSLNFGNMTLAGTYSVVGTITATTCVGNMSGSVNVTMNPLPAVFNVTEVGSGAYCAGSTGVTVGVSGSANGINYQLFNGSTATGSFVSGSGSALTMGVETVAGSYTIIATNAVTTCSVNMSGSASVSVNPTPTVYTLTGTTGYCAGGSFTTIGLSGSNTGVSYQLLNSGTAVGALTPGIGAALSFGGQPAGSYTVSAINTTTGCTSTMAGTISVSVNALPSSNTLSGGGTLCTGSAGMPITLLNSTTGVNYQLYNGASLVGLPVAGATGTPINFGLFSTPGTYTVVGTNAATGCSSTMAGSPAITVVPLPAVYAITGGGTYCAGAGGVAIGLSSSATATSYQLYLNGLATASITGGTGSAITFGNQTVNGAYTVIASTTTVPTCMSAMSGTATVSVNAVPAVYTISGGGSYCAGGAGVPLSLSNSDVGFSYQVLNGTSRVGVPMGGTSAGLSFGMETAAGNYKILATNNVTGCYDTMSGTATVVINALPTVDTVVGGGSYCPGGSGVAIGLNTTTSGVNYSLYNGGSLVATMPGGSPSFAFGLQTAPGVYTVSAKNSATSCVSNMYGNATVGIYPLPVVYNISGGGNYCPGGSGVVVGLSGSNTGVNYQLNIGSAPAIPVAAGTGLGMNFGLQTAPGAYTVVATNATTGCSSTMSGTANVDTFNSPAIYNATGGGSYCSGGAGSVIGLDGSTTGTEYQLIYGGATPVGTVVSGTGSAISFGPQMAAGAYTVKAVGLTSTCSDIMNNTVTVTINALPSTFTVTGGGAYCAGGTGDTIYMGGSDPSASYMLMNGTTAVGSSVAGTGTNLWFGPVTAAGSYTVMATNGGSGCMATMPGTANVSVNPLPSSYIVSGGGAYCASGAGSHVYLSGSNSGINYRTKNSATLGAVIGGTGMGLDFGPQPAAGYYNILATNSVTGCNVLMTDSVLVSINPLPPVHTVVSTSSNYCAGGTGVAVSLDGSDAGINYQLYDGSMASGLPVAGTGSTLAFGSLTLAGSYNIIATNATTGCRDSMAPGVRVTIAPLPGVYSVTGGGAYCNGGSGVLVGLSGSASGINYALYVTGHSLPVATVAGTGSPISFGLQTIAGNYTVVATNATTTCNNSMSGSATITINSLPTVYSVTGGGNYCSGTTGVNIGLSNSQLGITYQLMMGVVSVGTPAVGTGAAVSFGPQSTAGSYSVMATSTITGCSVSMAGTSSVGVLASPSVYAVTGGGGYCPSAAGVVIGLSSSVSGVTYKLYDGTTLVDTLTGTGASLSFGTFSAIGTYVVKATDNTTSCSTNMSGTANVSVDPLPTAYSVTGGGAYCAGGAGVHVGVSGSNTGVNYTLYNGSIPVVTVPGSGGGLDFGLLMAAGNYKVLATNASTGCNTYMSDSANVAVMPVVTPAVNISSGSGDTVCAGSFVTFTAMPGAGAGSTPSYTWSVNGVTASLGSVYSYEPVNGDVVALVMTSSANCAVPATASSTMTMNVESRETPTVSVTANPGTDVCQGTSVTYTPAAVYGGNTPTFEWFVGTGSTSFTGPSYNYTPANGDVVYCVMTSNYKCRLADHATSNRVNMVVENSVPPVVTISANPGQYVSSGATVTLTAIVGNAGSAPAYQWLINGTPVGGATNNIYQSNAFNNGDSVTCVVTTTGGCAGLVGFNSVTMHVANVGVQSVSAAGGSVTLVPNPNNGTFTLVGTTGNSSDEEVHVEVVNTIGQVVYMGSTATIGGKISYPVSLDQSLAGGMYLLNISSRSGNQVVHFVKQ